MRKASAAMFTSCACCPAHSCAEVAAFDVKWLHACMRAMLPCLSSKCQMLGQQYAFAAHRETVELNLMITTAQIRRFWQALCDYLRGVSKDWYLHITQGTLLARCLDPCQMCLLSVTGGSNQLTVQLFKLLCPLTESYDFSGAYKGEVLSNTAGVVSHLAMARAM